MPGRLPRAGFRSPRSPRRSWMKPPTRAALYARVSTTNHGQDVGLQLDELRAVAAHGGLHLAAEFVDEGVSRP